MPALEDLATSSGRLRKCDAENPILFQIKVTTHPSFI